MSSRFAFWVTVLGCAAPLLMYGETVNITLYPSYAGAAGVSGSPNSSAPGFGSSSWVGNPSADGGKSELYIPASTLFSSPVTIDDIQSVSYWTNKPGNSGSPDWSFYIYTAKTGSGDTASWYHTRLNSEPYLTNTPSASDPANTWHNWTTNDPSNPMLFYDTARDGGVYGTYTDPTLATLQSGTYTWANNTSYNYGNDVVNLFSLQTGSAWASNFDGVVDGLTVTLKNGDVANVNLEATPEPGTWGLGLAGFGLLLLGMRHRRRSAAV
ncbi:MAG: PEP-CTERM sorting domain-containing protein [Acidobacteriota bacterium]|nr:PEP-CTERM sorting domain-containing protein [Acidobacteriota bacterium]